MATGRTLADRVWEKVEVHGLDECWPFVGSRNEHGYGGTCLNGKHLKAHRAVFLLTRGYLPPVVRHRCDNPPCCNPTHLQGGSMSDNTQDMLARGRHFTPFGWAREDHPSTKYSADIVAAVKADLRSHRVIAAAYGMSKTHVTRIKRK